MDFKGEIKRDGHQTATYPQELGAAALGSIESEPTDAEPDNPFELTAEQHERSVVATAALAKKFGREESDFSVVKATNEAGESVFAVALTATERLDLGDSSQSSDAKRNWDKVTAENNDPFFVEVNGQKIDIRDNQTMQWLSAVVAANPNIHEWVWRTGEKNLVGSDIAPFAHLASGKAYPHLNRRSVGYRYLSIRPIVVV